jgi:GNAT superfamily N-acetyltransferase
MSLVFRSARAEDLEATDKLVVDSINDLTERHGFGPMASPSPPHFQLSCLEDDPDGLWVAEDGDQVLGFAWSWVGGDFWFLAQLFVAPGQQGRGIGQELLQRTLEHARKAGAVRKALITFTFNPVSQGLYIRHGLFPRFPIYFFSAPRDVLVARLRPKSLNCVRLADTESHLQNLASIDARSSGVSRIKHHRYLIKDANARGALLCEGDEPVGYAYVSRAGHVGPLAVARPEMLESAFRTALSMAVESGSAKISAFLPGPADTALSVAVGSGMQITFPLVLMSDYAAAGWTQYLPRNPGFM